eukprot:301153_1
MYQYSDEIFMSHHYVQNIQLHCGVAGDMRYIKYPTNELLDPHELLRYAQNEYESRRLPCEDVQIDCTGNNTDFMQKCAYEYKLNNAVDLMSILSDKDRPNCYWIQMNTLYTPYCKGTCGEPIMYYQHNISFDLPLLFYHKENTTDVTLTVESNYNTTRSYRKCHIYFGSANATDESLSSIDAIFASVLNIISETSKLIKDILLTPITSLRNEISMIHCQNEEKNIIQLTTYLSIRSIQNNQQEINALFDKGSTFRNESAMLLSALFDIPIRFIDEQEIHHVTHMGIRKWIIYMVASISLCIICLIMISVYFYRQKKMKAYTKFIRNPMIITIAIGEYNKPDHSVFKGYLPNLIGIHVDTKRIVELFRNQLNYEIFPNYDISNDQLQYIKQYWTLKEIMDLLQKQAEILDKNVIKYDKECKSMSGFYDGLIVVISSHGRHNKVITSDYKTIDQSAIHRLFSANKPDVRHIPRVFIYDHCDGNLEKKHEFRQLESNNNANDSYWRQEKKVDPISQPQPARLSTQDIRFSAISVGWFRGEDNPDFNLAVITATNPGFQSKMNQSNGSYFIRILVSKIVDNIINKNNKQFLFQIFESVQSDPKLINKQLPESKFNNQTRYIKFIKNGKNKIISHKKLSVSLGRGKVNKGTQIQLANMMTGHVKMNIMDDQNCYVLLEENYNANDNKHNYEQQNYSNTEHAYMNVTGYQ